MRYLVTKTDASGKEIDFGQPFKADSDAQAGIIFTGMLDANAACLFNKEFAVFKLYRLTPELINSSKL